jgi:hypothetical protein
MSNPVGELTIEPEPSPFHDDLFDAHDSLAMHPYPPYPTVVNKTGESVVRLFDDYDNIEIEASLHGSLVDAYHRLDNEQQFELARHIESAMGQVAISLFGADYDDFCKKETISLINNLPVLFEPINNAMLVGEWEDWEKKKMHIRSQFITDYDQQCLLLGGLAAFVTYLEQQ